MKQEFDDLLKEKLEAHVEPFREASWEGMAQQLDENKTDKRKWLLWPFAAVLVAGISVATYLYWTAPVSENTALNNVSTAPIAEYRQEPAEDAATMEVKSNELTSNDNKPVQESPILNNNKKIAKQKQRQTIQEEVAVSGSAKVVQTEIKQETATRKKTYDVTNTIKKSFAQNLTENKLIQTSTSKSTGTKTGKYKKYRYAANTMAVADKSGLSSNNLVEIGSGKSASGDPFVNTTNISGTSNYGNSEKEIVVGGDKKLEIIGDLPATEKLKPEADSLLMASAVKLSEDTAVEIPKQTVSKKKIVPIIAIAGGGSLALLDHQKMRDEQVSLTPQWEAAVMGGIGIGMKKKYPLLEILSGVGINGFSYKTPVSPDSAIYMNDTTQLVAFKNSYQTLTIPIQLKVNVFQHNNVTCYVKGIFNNHLKISQKFEDEYSYITPSNLGTIDPLSFPKNTPYGIEDFNKQGHHEKEVKSVLFNDKNYFFTTGLALGIGWKFLYLETNYLFEPGVTRRSNKHNIGVVAGMRFMF